MVFKPLEDVENIPIGYNFVLCHMIFDVKMKKIFRQYRLVAGERMAETPATMTYTSILYHETDCLAPVISALNNLEAKCVDVMNAYITAPTEEKIWKTVGPKFGPDYCKEVLVVHTLYGMKSAGAAFLT